MPIEVELPNGGIAEFPDDTSPDIIKATLQKQFKGGQSSSATPAPSVKQENTSNDDFLAGITGYEPPEDKHTGSYLTRAGLQGLGAYEGLGRAAKIALNPADALTRAIAGQNPFEAAKTLLQFNPGKIAADRMNLDKPETQGEQLASEAAEGAASIVPTLLFGGLPAIASRFPKLASALTSFPKLQLFSGAASGAAGEKARQEGAGPVGQLAASLAGGITPLAIGNKGRSLLNSSARGIVNPEKAQAFIDAGMDAPSLGAVSDSGIIQSLEGGLGQSVTGAGVMRKAQEQGKKVFDDVINNAASKLANGQPIPESLEAMGRGAREATETAKQDFRNAAKQFENNFYASREQLPAKLENTMAFIEKEAERLGKDSAAAKALRERLLRELGPMVEDAQGRMTIQGQPITQAELDAQPYLKNLVTEEPGKLNIASIRKRRGQLQEKLDKPPVASLGDADSREIQALNSALKKDLEAALPPEDLTKIQEYNKWYAKNSGLRDDIDRVFFGKSRDDTAIARAILSADARQLEQLRSVIGDDAFNQLRAGALQEVTRGRYGPSSDVAARMFSEGKTAMQPEARQALFNGADQNVSDIARALQESRTYTNTSNTANANNLANVGRLLLGGGAGYALGGIPAAAGIIAGPYAAARALTSRKLIDSAIRRALNPKAVRWGNIAPNFASPWLRSIIGQLYAAPNGAKQ